MYTVGMENEEGKNEMPAPEKATQQIAQTYVRTLWWPVLVAALFSISALYNTNQQALTVIAHIGLMAFIVAVASKKHATWQYAAILGGCAGAIVAFMVALYKLFMFFHLIYIFNLFTQPLFTALLDAVSAGFLMILLQLAQNFRHSRFHIPIK